MRALPGFVLLLLPLVAHPTSASVILALESDADAGADSEVFFVSYPTFDDLVADTNGAGVFGDINVASGFSIGGLAYDGQFRMAIESDADAGADSEVFFVSYPTFDDLGADTNGSGTFGAINVASGFGVRGLTWMPDAPPPPAPVPLPSGLPLLLGAMGLLAVWRRQVRPARRTSPFPPQSSERS